MASMSSYFNIDDEETLIELVKGYPALYNVKSPSYKNFSLKAIAWKEIAEKIDKSEDACKAKWKHIRDWYIRKKKAGKMPSGASVTSLAHLISRYDKLRFLGKSDKSTAELNQDITTAIKEEPEESEENSEESNSMLEDNEERPLIKYTKTPTILNLRRPIKKTQTKVKKFFSLHSQTKRKRTAEKLANIKRQRTKEFDGKEVISVPTPKNPIDEFFGAMASIVKQLPTSVQVQVKQDVSQIVLMAESRVVLSHDNISQHSNASSDSLNGCQEDEAIYIMEK